MGWRTPPPTWPTMPAKADEPNDVAAPSAWIGRPASAPRPDRGTQLGSAGAKPDGKPPEAAISAAVEFTEVLREVDRRARRQQRTQTMTPPTNRTDEAGRAKPGTAGG